MVPPRPLQFQLIAHRRRQFLRQPLADNDRLRVRENIVQRPRAAGYKFHQVGISHLPQPPAHADHRHPRST